MNVERVRRHIIECQLTSSRYDEIQPGRQVAPRAVYRRATAPCSCRSSVPPRLGKGKVRPRRHASFHGQIPCTKVISTYPRVLCRVPPSMSGSKQNRGVQPTRHLGPDLCGLWRAGPTRFLRCAGIGSLRATLLSCVVPRDIRRPCAGERTGTSTVPISFHLILRMNLFTKMPSSRIIATVFALRTNRYPPITVP